MLAAAIAIGACLGSRALADEVASTRRPPVLAAVTIGPGGTFGTSWGDDPERIGIGAEVGTVLRSALYLGGSFRWSMARFEGSPEYRLRHHVMRATIDLGYFVPVFHGRGRLRLFVAVGLARYRLVTGDVGFDEITPTVGPGLGLHNERLGHFVYGGEVRLPLIFEPSSPRQLAPIDGRVGCAFLAQVVVGARFR